MLTIKFATNPKYTTVDQSVIELSVQFVEFGDAVLPFGATQDDVEEHGRELYARALAGEFGPIAAYEPPVHLGSTGSQPTVVGAQTL